MSIQVQIFMNKRRKKIVILRLKKLLLAVLLFNVLIQKIIHCKYSYTVSINQMLENTY